MPINPPILPNGRRIKERIGVYGLPKIGKTHLFFTIAKWHQDYGSPAQFYGVNTDTSWDVLSTNEQFQDLANIHWEDATDFQSFLDHVKEYHKLLTPDDWLCTDLQDDAWTFAQDEYARALAKANGLDIEDFSDLWVDHGKEYPIKGWDWGSINARYRTLANNYILRGNGHRFIISGQKDVLEPSANMKENDDMRKLRKMFEHVGSRPDGQKGDAFRWHSILHVSSMGERRQGLITAGERFGNRRHMGKKMSKGNSVKPEAIDDFFTDYLVDVAGWTID